MKYILDERDVEYSNNEDLHDLYRKVGRTPNLSPDGHDEQVFKKILTGVTLIVQGVASLRNYYGDAHGKGRASVAPQARHTELVVNLAGTMCTFLIQTHLNGQ